MDKSNIQVIRLSDYDSIDQIMSKHHDGLEGKPNGMAILFDSAPSSNLGIQTGLLKFALENYSSRIRGMDSISELNTEGEIDADLKDFLYNYMNIMTHALNSCSVRPNGSNLKEFEYFDKIELKSKLETLINRL
ncbi:hypothetical protein OTK49_03265 [Vibrio coralliirubri]|uniref:hypothetical protein n=1 Tax=Vibrio coralliirubri TaxID=1516159 RepID=UPI002283FEBD|nr:hypothetical protein [Vibrio coralliirubri]MCY9861536.1 hypothetical protein [Vibrio coralliirubri]